MRASKFFVSTLKEAPADAELVSHKLMLRAGLIRRLAGGIYSWMPLGLRVVRQVEAVIREEMNKAGAIEMFMPAIQPSELWKESGRWQMYGPELLRLKDRHDREFCVGPTQEEIVTDHARREIKSYRQLPVHFYQLQTKFRDEIRPRFGVMRSREFVMKDGYSFHANFADLRREYENMYETYTRIFTRLGLNFRAVAADTGSIGGTGSHEFHVLAESGEDAIAFSSDSDYAANVELAEAIDSGSPRGGPTQSLEKVATPGTTRCEDVAALLGVPLANTVKAIAAVSREKFVLLLLRGDHELNEIKTQKLPNLDPFRFATDAEIEHHLHCRPGYIGPVGIASDIRVIADRAVAAMSNFVCGANEANFHLTGTNWGRDLPEPELIADIRKVVAGDPSPDGRGTLAIQRGIEVGHIFQLRTKYSKAMQATFLDESGKANPFEMGCYGIGVTRIVGAAVEQNHDSRGIIWPDAMAPFRIAIVPLGYSRSSRVRELADRLYSEFTQAGISVFLEDRDERPGVLLTDLELIGIPHRVVIGERGLSNGAIEYQFRRDTNSEAIPTESILEFVRNRLL